MVIKVSSLRSVLHEETELLCRRQRLLRELETYLQCEILEAELDDYDCDMKLIYIETGGSEGLFLENVPKLKEPYYFLTSGGNNSLAAAMEILTYLNLHGKTGEILHGAPEYIALRIRRIAEFSKAEERLHRMVLGVLGKPSDWLISSVPDYDEIRRRFGIRLVDIPLERVLALYEKSGSGRNPGQEFGGFSRKELDQAERVHAALEEICLQYQLDGLTIRCFDLLFRIKTTGCLGLSLLNRNGNIAVCEGDIAAMISMAIVKAVTGASSFQANPSRMDPQRNEIVFAHCTIPLDMVESYRFDTHFESGLGVAIKGELKERDITIFRLSSDLQSYFLSEGTILRNLNEPDLCRTQIAVSIEEPVEHMLKHPCGNHHILFYGRHKDAIEAFMRMISEKRAG